MGRIERIPIIENPVLLDRVIGEVQTGLADNLSWLDHSFGKAERLAVMQETRRIWSPNVYAGGNEYFPLSPDSNIGNFSFFTIDDPQTIDWIPKQRGALTVSYGLIFWFDLRKVYPGTKVRNTEAVKAEILKVLNGGFWMKYGRLTITQVEERAENIYRGFTLDEVPNQFLMHPYAGFRFEGLLTVNENC